MAGKSYITLGSPGWEDSLRSATEDLDSNFWRDFRPICLTEVESIESSLRRELPADFKLFLTTFGSGDFPLKFGGGFFTPNEIVQGCSGPLLMLLGSDGWASLEDQRRFYVSRGEYNPSPTKFTENATRIADVDLLDLVQIGYDGMSCYYQLICPSRKDRPSGFCKITPEGTVEDRYASFEAGLNAILLRFGEMERER